MRRENNLLLKNLYYLTPQFWNYLLTSRELTSTLNIIKCFFERLRKKNKTFSLINTVSAAIFNCCFAIYRYALALINIHSFFIFSFPKASYLLKHFTDTTNLNLLVPVTPLLYLIVDFV